MTAVAIIEKRYREELREIEERYIDAIKRAAIERHKARRAAEEHRVNCLHELGVLDKHKRSPNMRPNVEEIVLPDGTIIHIESG